MTDQRTATRARIVACITAREPDNTHALAIASACGLPLPVVDREIDWLSHYERRHIIARRDGRGWTVNPNPEKKP